MATQTVSEFDSNNIKTVVEYKTNSEGKQVKVTRRIYVNRKPIRVVERHKKMKPFGQCTKGNPRGMTYLSDPVYMEWIYNKEENKDIQLKNERDQLEKELRALLDAYVKDPKTPLITSDGIELDQTAWMRQAASIKYDSTLNKNTDVTWKPSWKKGTDKPPPQEKESIDNTTTIKVSNLSEETTERDLSSMFGKFGYISRINLVKDRNTNISRGYGFICFNNRKDAELAMSKMQGYGLHHQRICIDWAKP